MMLRAVATFLLLFPFFLCAGQDEHFGSIRVKVLDAENDQPLPYVNVYLNRTTIGGYTDENGEIEVKKIPFGTHELILSSIGHKPMQRKLIIRSEQPTYMTVKLLVRMLNEVQVKAKRDDKWKRQFARFEKLFFGVNHVKQCAITNPWILNFKTVQGDFIAEAREPLKIENNYLGYNLEFEIKNCVFTSSRYVILGNVRFEEKTTGDSVIAHTWKEHREKIFLGSPQHFLRSVINNNMVEEGYDIYSDITSDNDIVRNANFLQNVGASILKTSFEGRVEPSSNAGMYTLKFPARLEVHYRRKRVQRSAYRNVNHAVSWMEVKNQTLTVNRQGLVQNPESLTLSGDMGELKVADWLPLDYRYAGSRPADPIVAPAVVTDVLLEKPYIQTDRNYYYNRETVWLKGYMNYFVPLLKDTLSQSVYVDLIDHAGNVAITKLYPVTEGTFSGDIVLDKSLAPGLYQLKAYTQWMLNFDPRLIFTKTISLLGEKEAVRIVSDYKYLDDTTKNITIKTYKDSYAAREMIIVTIDAIDSLDFSTVSNLSVSVTDIEQAVPLSNEKTILTEFPFAGTDAKDSIADITFGIEAGIDFKGTFWLGKKQVQGIVTVFEETGKESFGTITNELGRFEKTLSFIDTVNFYIKAVSVNNKKGSVVMDMVKHLPAPSLEFEQLSLDVYTAENSRRDRGLNLNAATLLKEVTIEAKKIERAPSPAVIHPRGDYVVTGDWIAEHNVMDVTTALARKVPGMSGPLANGLVRVFPPGSAVGDPLIVVDGVALVDGSVDALNDIPIRSIAWIDVLKFGATASYGSRGANGVIAIYTKKGTGAPEEKQGFDKSKLQAVKLGGYSPVTTFTAPDYSKPTDVDYFDYRSTIFWKPDVITDGKEPAVVSFYAADASTKYRIVVEGVTKDGMPVRGEKIISIISGK